MRVCVCDSCNARVSESRIEHAYVQMDMARIEIDVCSFFALFLMTNRRF